MAIPKFNTYGLLPPGIHPATMGEVEVTLAFSAKRRSLIEDGLKPVAKELVKMGVSELYVDGSFVTEKPSPDDVDGFVLAESTSDLYRDVAGEWERWKGQYRMDVFPAATDMNNEGSRSYFEELFGHTKGEPPQAKGLLKLKLRG